MNLAERTFKRSDYTITSKYGWRTHPVTHAESFHYGIDYGTKKEKWGVFALETGIATAVGYDKNNGNYVWIEYPRLDLKIFYCHLDQVFVKRGQSVNNDVSFATVGKTGRATGVHLHMGVKHISDNKYFNHFDYEYNPDIFDTDFTLRLQKYYGTKQDGVISGQIFQKYNALVLTKKRGILGSQLVKALQKDLKVKVDGQLGKETITAWELAYGLKPTGFMSSSLVREAKQRLLGGKLL